VAKKRERRKQPTVVGKHGEYRFQTGMVTASLIERGLSMPDAFSISRELRDRISDRSEITTDALGEEIEKLLAKHPEIDLPAAVVAEDPALPAIRHGDKLRRFSREALLRELITLGVGGQVSLDMTATIEDWLRSAGVPEVDEDKLDKEVRRRLTDLAGKSYARRFQVTRWIRRSDRAVVIMIGGATGTGKSTLATELAARLGIRMITSTDMIRETMRTVLSAQVLPGLHDHSFRGVAIAGQVVSDPRERVLAGFHQQVAQVAVGVRAVVDRALREAQSIIIEGTHILPPFDQYLPAVNDASSVGFVLAVPEEERHIGRFPQRSASAPLRPAGDYLEAFQSVRWIHDELMALADDTESVVIASGETEETVSGAINYLSRALLTEQSPSKKRRARTSVRTLFVIFDGLSDEPNPALGGLTPLAAAGTPTLRALAGSGGQGVVVTQPPGGHAAAETDEGIAALLGVEWKGVEVGRGLFEALGQGVPLPPGAIVFRGNLASAEVGGAIVDRRAGRIRAGVGDLVAGLRDVDLPGGVRGSVYPGHEHRLVLQLQGPGLSHQVGDSDPGNDGVVQSIVEPVPLDDTPEAARTAAALQAFLQMAEEHLRTHPHNEERVSRGLLPANCIITRGAASVADLGGLHKTDIKSALVAACPTALGVGRALGIQASTGPMMTGNLDTDLESKFEAAKTLLADYPFVIVHLKAADIAGHDRRPLAKRDFIAKADAALGRMLTNNPELTTGLRVVVSADHGTSSLSGQHLASPVPLLLATWPPEGDVARFDESSATRGALGVLRPNELSDLLW